METKKIINIFTQDKSFNTNYKSLKEVFTILKKQFDNEIIAIPYKYGCGIAYREWEKVEQILLDVFDDHDCTVYKLEGNL